MCVYIHTLETTKMMRTNSRTRCSNVYEVILSNRGHGPSGVPRFNPPRRISVIVGDHLKISSKISHYNGIYYELL